MLLNRSVHFVEFRHLRGFFQVSRTALITYIACRSEFGLHWKRLWHGFVMNNRMVSTSSPGLVFTSFSVRFECNTSYHFVSHIVTSHPTTLSRHNVAHCHVTSYHIVTSHHIITSNCTISVLSHEHIRYFCHVITCYMCHMGTQVTFFTRIHPIGLSR